MDTFFEINIPPAGEVLERPITILTTTPDPSGTGCLETAGFEITTAGDKAFLVAALVAVISEPTLAHRSVDCGDEVAEGVLAAVEASFPTGAQLDAEDELRDRLTAEGIAHGNF